MIFQLKLPHIGNVIILNHELIFFRGVGIPPTSSIWAPSENHSHGNAGESPINGGLQLGKSAILAILVFGDWNMTFIFLHMGNNHPN